jgi:seryl-tRNA synthetase
VGNIVHESVPVSNNEDNNRVEKTWGVKSDLKITGKRGAYHHHEVLEAIGGYDPERGQKIAGHRGYFLKGPGVMLNLALVQYGLQFLAKRGYTAMQPPFFMKKEVMAETCQLSDFDDQLYQVKEGKTSDDEFYLIATSGMRLI